jgi:hypothetical protein
MVIDDLPTLAVLDVGEAVARGQGLRLAILHIGERVVDYAESCSAVLLSFVMDIRSLPFKISSWLS